MFSRWNSICFWFDFGLIFWFLLFLLFSFYLFCKKKGCLPPSDALMPITLEKGPKQRKEKFP